MNNVETKKNYDFLKVTVIGEFINLSTNKYLLICKEFYAFLFIYKNTCIL